MGGMAGLAQRTHLLRGQAGVTLLHELPELKVVLVGLEQALPVHPGHSASFHFLDGEAVMTVVTKEMAAGRKWSPDGRLARVAGDVQAGVPGRPWRSGPRRRDRTVSSSPKIQWLLTRSDSKLERAWRGRGRAWSADEADAPTAQR